MAKKYFIKKEFSLKCEIKNSDFTLDIERNINLREKIKEYLKKNDALQYVEFNWPYQIRK